MPHVPRRGPPPARSAPLYEVEALPGLEPVVRAEMQQLFGAPLAWREPLRPRPGLVGFAYGGDPAGLLQLRTAVAAYRVRHFPVPRPRGLLGDQHLRALLDTIAQVRRLAPEGSYRTLYVSAAGAESSVMQRLKQMLAQHTGLAIAGDEGDLLLRVRPAIYAHDGWEVSLRLSPRPLATRPWRICNMEGALNATVAQAMVRLMQPRRDDLFLNLGCGSGTLLIERRAWGLARQLLGCDTGAAALACARRNVAASGYAADIALCPWDATALPLADGSMDALCADLPFGHLVGSHEENTALYPRLLNEAARVARPGARFALITHEVRLTESILRTMTAWETVATLPVFLGGLHPRIFVLRRT